MNTLFTLFLSLFANAATKPPEAQPLMDIAHSGPCGVVEDQAGCWTYWGGPTRGTVCVCPWIVIEG